MHEIVYKETRLVRYFHSAVDTFELVLRGKPNLVFAQNPSIALATLLVALSKWFGYRIVIDAHNSGIRPHEGRSNFLMIIAKWLQRHADLTLVTNEGLEAVVLANGGRAFVLPDKIPHPPCSARMKLCGKRNIAFICTFAQDEPFDEVFMAANLLPEDFVIHVTGNFGAHPPSVSHRGNLRFLGFIPEDEYWSLLASVDLILDLTLREDCLVCGAYEAVAIGKPAVLSETKAITQYFNRGCLYAQPNAYSIAEAVMRGIREVERLRAEMGSMRQSLEYDWQRRLERLEEKLRVLCERRSSTSS